jgi:hypothetical protein
MSVQSLESQSESWTLALAKCWPLQKNLVNLALLFDAHSFKVWPPSCFRYERISPDYRSAD